VPIWGRRGGRRLIAGPIAGELVRAARAGAGRPGTQRQHDHQFMRRMAVRMMGRGAGFGPAAASRGRRWRYWLERFRGRGGPASSATTRPLAAFRSSTAHHRADRGVRGVSLRLAGPALRQRAHRRTRQAAGLAGHRSVRDITCTRRRSLEPVVLEGLPILSAEAMFCRPDTPGMRSRSRTEHRHHVRTGRAKPYLKYDVRRRTSTPGTAETPR